MKSSALVAIFQIPESTIRSYAKQYAQYLSPSASAGRGSHRDYTDHDVRVLKQIVAMKRQTTMSAEDIEGTLKAYQADNWDRLPALDDPSAAIIPSPTAMLESQADRAVMRREIELLREQLATQETRAKEQLQAERADRDNLLQRLHRAETMLELYETGRLKSK